MKKFTFAMPSIDVFAGSLEEALGQVASHISGVARHVANERPIEDSKPRFTIQEGGEVKPAVLEALKPEQHVGFDHATAKHGAVPLTLDPDSAAGKAHAEQKKHQESERTARKRTAEKDQRTDAENLALHSANEQAAHAAKS